MASLFKLTFRGTTLSSQFAWNTWWLATSPAIITDEAAQARALAQAGLTEYGNVINPIMHSTVNLTRVLAEGYDAPAAFYEQAAALSGVQGGEVMPAFVAFGFRQYRTNSDFRTSTHRLPGVRENNVQNGNFVYDGEVTPTMTNAAADFFEQTLAYVDGVVTYEFMPVLIRTQYTPRGEENPVTIIYDPPQTSEVTQAAFYGVTSQVSRKYILPA